jgi:predicted nucleic acid-binding protein
VIATTRRSGRERLRQRNHPAGGPPGLIIRRFLRDAAFEVVLSPAIAEEVLRALAYPKVRKVIRNAVEPKLWFEDILILADLVPGERDLSGVCSDPDDDKYLAAALEGPGKLRRDR